jgi:hypothetical protein
MCYIACNVLPELRRIESWLTSSRSHHKSPVRGGGEDEAVPIATKLLLVQKWSIMWKSLIASSLKATLFPYCRYIRALDFRDLENLLDDDHFKKISKQFFAGPLAPFYKADTLKRPNGKKYERLNIKAIIDSVGEVVTQHTPMLELISGQRGYTSTQWFPAANASSQFICANKMGPSASSAPRVRTLGW